MTLDEVRLLADDVLGQHLSSFGFRSTTVVSAVDGDGREYLEIEAHFGATPDKIDARATLRADQALHAALLARGEDRFPDILYLVLDPAPV